MSQNVTTTQSTGVSVLSILGVIFILCKVFEVAPIAGWSWWWVLAPFWVPACIGLGVLAVVLLVGLLIAVFSK